MINFSAYNIGSATTQKPVSFMDVPPTVNEDPEKVLDKTLTKKVYSNRLHSTVQKSFKYAKGDKETLNEAKQQARSWEKSITDDNDNYLKQLEHHKQASETTQIIAKVAPKIEETHHSVTNELALAPKMDKIIKEATAEAPNMEKITNILKKVQTKADPIGNLPKISPQDVVNTFTDRIKNENGATLAIFASSGAGKTTLLTNLLNSIQLKNPDQIITLFSPSMNASVYKSFHTDIVKVPDLNEQMIECQRKINSSPNIQQMYSFLNVLDDIVDSTRSMSQLKQFLIDRNNKISTILSIQDSKLLAKKSRGSVNYVLIGKQNNREAQKSMIESFLLGYDLFPNKQWDKSYQIFDKLTENHHWIFIDQIQNKCYYL